jgi:hypothetical protein
MQLQLWATLRLRPRRNIMPRLSLRPRRRLRLRLLVWSLRRT